MVRTRRQAAASACNASSHIIEQAYILPLVWDYVGEGRYLQVAVCKSIAQSYATRFGPFTSRELSVTAAEDGCLGLLMWADSIGCVSDKYVFLGACKRKRMNILEHFRRGSASDVGTQGFEVAAREGHLEIVRWLREHDFPWNQDVTRAAAASGRLEILQFLFANGCPWHNDLCADACRGGHLNVLRWLHNRGLPLTTETCSCAALSGNLEMVQFLRAHGCPWNRETVRCARIRGHHDLAQWALENGCPSL